MTTVTLHLRGGGSLLAQVDDALALGLVERWSNALPDSAPVALHNAAGEQQTLRFVRLVDVAAVEYVLEGDAHDG